MIDKTDVLIVTVTEEESRAVMMAFREATGNNSKPESISDRTYLNFGEINGTRVFMALSEMGSGGVGGSQEGVRKGIEALSPSAVIMVGIAFGINEQKQAIGDVLVSERLMLYDLQRVGTNKEGNIEIIPRDDRPHASPWLINQLQVANLTWDKSKAKIRFGLILSGDKLVDNIDFRGQLLMFEPETIGGDMEGAGLYVACQNSKVDWILVKAICDWADGEKAKDKDARQQLAAHNAAAFVLHALQQAPLKRDREPYLQKEEGPQKFEQPFRESPKNIRISWIDAKGLFQIDKFTLAYIPLMNDWRKDKSPISELKLDSIKVSLDQHRYQLLDVFEKTQIDYDFHDDPSCKLLECYIGDAQNLNLVLQETSYGDYLKSGEHLDDPFPIDPRETFRSALATIVQGGGGEVQPQDLTNICGTGIFLITRDDKIIVSRHSEYSHVYPERWTFSASGLMKWGACPHPFMEIARKTFIEIRHQVDPSKVRLIGLGADARKLYFQFSFFEETWQTASEIIERHNIVPDYENQGLLRDRPRELFYLPFDLEKIISAIFENCWEPSAEACILTLCAKRFGPEEVAQALHARQGDWSKHEMRDEWDLRSTGKGDLPDMSVRYPLGRLPEERKRYIKAILGFMQNDLSNKDVIEIGCGTGGLTIRLIGIAKYLTCIDLCERMIQRNKQRLGKKANKVNYMTGFMQDYPTRKHQVAVCSLVLIHNVSDSDFIRLVGRICDCSDVAFIFEDITEGRPTSRNVTRLRPKQELVNAFEQFNFHLERSGDYKLFDDQIAFLKFVRM